VKILFKKIRAKKFVKMFFKKKFLEIFSGFPDFRKYFL